MLMIATILTAATIIGVIAAVITESSVLAWVVIGLAALGLALLAVDSVRERKLRAERYQVLDHYPTCEDQLFGEHDVQRDIEREEHATSRDMVRSSVPREEAIKSILPGAD